MKFLYPEFIYYMLPPLFILFGLLLTQKEANATFFSCEVLDKLRVSSNTLTLKARNALFFLAGIFMILALAHPVITEGKVRVKQKSADILIALDISNSMLAKDVYPSRLALAKKKAIDFIKKIKQDRVGIIAFAKSSYMVSPLSFDKEAVAFLLSNLNTNSITEQGTNFMTLLQTVKDSSKNKSKKYLLIFSDGGDKEDFSNEISYAKDNDIVVFVIGIGTKKGAPIKMNNGEFLTYKGKTVITKLNENISSLATQTGGIYIRNTISNEDINEMYKELEKIVTKKELKNQMIDKYIPLFYFPLGIAMILILLATSSMSKRKKVYVPSVWLLPLLMMLNSNLHAGFLDFKHLQDAKESYKNKNYIESAKSYKKYALKNDNAQAYYDAANAYYRAKEYKKAIQMYKKVKTKDSDLMAHSLYNLGNAYAKSQKYKEAIKAYEESLKIKDDKEARDNLNEVKKFLKKKKNQQNKNKKNKNQNKKNDNNRKKDKNNQNKNKNQKNQQKKDKNQSKQDKQNEQNKKNNNSSQNQKHKSKNAQKKKDKNKSSNGQKKQNDSKSSKSKEQLKKLSNKPPKQVIKHKEDKMSDAEEKKWLKSLNQNNQTFLYMMKKSNDNGDDENEKPW